MFVTKAVSAMLAMTVIFSPATISPTALPPTLAQPEMPATDHTNLYALADASCRAQQPDLTMGTVIFHKGRISLNGTTPDVGTFIRNGDILTTSEDGYVAIELGNGKVVSVQPVTHLTVECNTTVVGVGDVPARAINKAHLLGAVRG